MKKRTFRILTVMISLLLAVTGFGGAAASAAESKLSQKIYGTPEELLIPNNYTVAIFNGTVGMEDGHNTLYTVAKGKPGYLNVIDLDDYKLLRSIPLSPSESSWAHTVAPDGTVYIGADGGGGRLWRYSPETHNAEVVAQFSGESWPNSITTDDQGRVYIGTYPGGKVFQYDPATNQLRDYGRMIGAIAQEYVRSIAYQGGYVYAGTAHRQIVKVNIETGEKINIAANVPAIEDVVYDLSTIDDRYLLARYTDGSGIPGEGFIYDTQTEEWLDVKIDRLVGLHATDSLDGKLYFLADGLLQTFDLNTYEIESTGMQYGSGFRGVDWVEFPNNPELPGKNLVTVRYDGGVAIMNIETKQVHLLPPIVPGLPGVVNRLAQVSETQMIATGSQARSSLIDLTTKTAQPFSIGQADSIYAEGNKVYLGVYPEGALFEYDLTQPPGNNNPRRLSVLGNDQERLVHITGGNGKIYISTISGYGTLGGSLTVYDPATRETRVHRNVVQNQSVLSTALYGNKLFGSTTIRNGLGSDPTEEEAKIFVWDTVEERKIAEFPLRIPGLDKPIFIGDLSVGPDGLIWGASYEFIFAINPDTYEIVKSKKIHAKLNFSQWAHHPIRWSEDGLLYVLFNDKLTVIDPDTLESRTLTDAARFDLGWDGNIYFTDWQTNTYLYRIEVDGDIEEPFPDVSIPVSNAGFEEGGTTNNIPGWSPFFAPGNGFSYELTTERSFTGSTSLKTIDTLRTASVAVIGDKVPVIPGETYEAGVNLYIESGQPGIMFRFYDTNNREITTWETHLDESRLAQWQTVTLRGKAPENAAYARFLAVTTRYNIAVAYYDDFYVKMKDKVVPISVAVLQPAPNEAGWNNTDTSVSIDAEQAYRITYSAEGAHTIAPTTVQADHVTLLLTEEGKTTLMYYATNHSGVQEAPQTIEVAIDKTSPVIHFEAEPVYTVSQSVYLSCTATDALSGLAGDPCADMLLERPAYELEPGSYDVTVTAIDKAGNAAAETFTFQVVVTYEGLAELAGRFAGEDTGLAEALRSKLLNAKAAAERGAQNAKDGMVKAFINQVKAQSGKKLTEEHAQILIRYAEHL